MHDTGILAGGQAQGVRAVGVLQLQRAFEVIHDGLGGREQIGGIVLELEQRIALQRGELAGRRGENLVWGEAAHATPPAPTRSEVLLRRHSAS